MIVNQKRLEEIPKNLSLSTRITIIKWKEVFSTCRNAYFSGQKFLCQTKRTVKRNQRNFTPLTWFYLMFVLRENCFMASNGPSHNEANDFMEVHSDFYKSMVAKNFYDTFRAFKNKSLSQFYCPGLFSLFRDNQNNVRFIKNRTTHKSIFKVLAWEICNTCSIRICQKSHNTVTNHNYILCVVWIFMKQTLR